MISHGWFVYFVLTAFLTGYFAGRIDEGIKRGADYPFFTWLSKKLRRKP